MKSVPTHDSLLVMIVICQSKKGILLIRSAFLHNYKKVYINLENYQFIFTSFKSICTHLPYLCSTSILITRNRQLQLDFRATVCGNKEKSKEMETSYFYT